MQPGWERKLGEAALPEIQRRVTGLTCSEHNATPTAFLAPDGTVAFRVCCEAQDERLATELPRLMSS